jgi:hypothetical protein
MVVHASRFLQSVVAIFKHIIGDLNVTVSITNNLFKRGVNETF